MSKNKKSGGLGRSLIRSRFEAGVRQNPDGSWRHTTELDDGPSWMKMQSITQETDLDAFLTNATLAGTEFTAERLNVKVISLQDETNPFLLTAEKERETLEKHEMHRDRITVPRRPFWDKNTTKDQLEQNEREAFLEWKRDLALLEEQEELLLTPYERNLEVWRQLWRVVERSEIVVQIVDARNPLLFRCADLEVYVKQVDPSKRNLLLINKSDLLSLNQRKIWAEYLTQAQIEFKFFSAAMAQMEVESNESAVESTSILSAIELIEYLESQFDASDLKEGVVGFVGYPNVGKSSTMNALIGAKKVTVSSTPGKTKHFQTIHLSSKLVLCDCPGLVFPTFATTKADMVTNGILPIDQLREFTGPSALVAQRVPKNILESIYGIQIFTRDKEGIEQDRAPTAEEFLRSYAVARGFKKAGQGNPDESRAARAVLKDYVNGKLLFVHPPPNVDSDQFNKPSHKRMMLYIKQKQQQLPSIEPSNENKMNLDNSKMDKEFFKPSQVQAKTNGKFANTDFSRVDIFPTQTTDAAKPIDKDASKKHRKGKKHVKQRDYWTKDYDY